MRSRWVAPQVGPGVQGSPSGVEGTALVAAVAMDGLLDPASASVQGIAGEADHVEGIHPRHGVGQLPRRWRS